MIEFLQQIDNSLLALINPGLASPMLDTICPMLREKSFWIPVYALLSAFLLMRYEKNAFWILLAIGLVILGADQFTSSILKPLCARPRPCHEPSLMALRKIVPCGGPYGFASSHAANHFGLSCFLFLLWNRNIAAGILLYFWAASVGFAQIYCGVHYPGDVLAGALIGILWAMLIHRGFRSFVLYKQKPKEHTSETM